MAGELISDGLTQRIAPALPVHAVKTYQIVQPLATHFRPATCEEADCPAWRHGWRTAVDERTDLGQSQARYIRREARRSFTEERREDGLTVFTFTAGQACFAAHRVPNGRPQRFIERGGDWRGNPRGEIREHVRGEDWQDSFANHQDRLQTAIERG